MSERVRLGIVTRWSMRAAVQGHLENLRQVQGLAVSGLGNLFATAKAVRNDEGLLSNLAHGREQLMLANGQRHIIVTGLKAKGTSHTAAPRVEQLRAPGPQGIASITESDLEGYSNHGRTDHRLDGIENRASAQQASKLLVLTLTV